MASRIRFLPGEQKAFIEQVYKNTCLTTKELAELAKVHPRSFIDWRREKVTMTLRAAELFSSKFNIPLPENKDLLLNRWKNVKHEFNKKGGINRFNKYGNFFTPEGRSKGGRISWLRRKSDPSILKKYANLITRPEESIELAELVGILLGDGGLSRFQCVIYLNSDTDVEYAQYTARLITELFQITPTVRKQSRAKVILISVSSVDMIEYLLQIGLLLGNKVHLQVKVPDWIWSKPEYVRWCIRGLMDTDGCFAISRYKVNGKQYAYPKIIFSNRSQPILNFVSQGLKQLGFTPVVISNKQVWLCKQNEVRKYLEQIGTSNYKPTIKKILEGDSDGLRERFAKP